MDVSIAPALARPVQKKNHRPPLSHNASLRYQPPNVQVSGE